MKTMCPNRGSEGISNIRQITISALLAALFFLRAGEPARGQSAFNYAPISGPIISASLSIDFAGMTANPFVGGTAVNYLQLWNASGQTSLDLSQALFGNAAWPSPPLINQGPLQTGFF